MSTLFVSHSVGDSAALIATAKSFIKKNSEHKIIVLAIGNAAEKKWNEALLSNAELKNSVFIKTLDSSLKNKAETTSLEADEFKTFQTAVLDPIIQEEKIENVLIGTPSQNKAGLAFQIAEYLSHHFKNDHLFIYNDYLFKENDHCYWETLERTKKWSQNVTHLVPLPKTRKVIHAINPSLQVEVVGHPSIDTSLSRGEVNKAHVQESLAIKGSQSLLFISGSKDLAKDKALLEALFQALEKDPNPELELRLGVHPGITDPNNYITGILNLIAQFPSINQHIKLFVKPSLITQLSLTHSNEKYILSSLFNSDDVAHIADGVASTPPSTLFTVAALQGKPAYYHEADKRSYLPSTSFLSGRDELPLFFTTMQKNRVRQPMSQTELGLSEKPFSEQMAEQFTFKN
ncbi:MAG: hypothetical protein V4471_06755 [Pseudomonadota bacterium]